MHTKYLHSNWTSRVLEASFVHLVEISFYYVLACLFFLLPLAMF